MLINNISLGQILNGSFENWTFLPNASSNSQPWALNDWIHCNKVGDPIPINEGLPGTYRDDIAQLDSFALTVSRWYGNTYEITKFKNKCTINPTALNGFYKYSDNALTNNITDTALISVFLTKYNPNSQTNDTVGSGKIELVTAENYTLFHCPIIYSQLNIAPDSILILIQPSKFGFGVGIPICLSGGYCSYLTLDNISLTTSTKTTEPEIERTFVVFPNPASSEISIVGDILHKKMIIYNALGELVYIKFATSENEIVETNNFKSGIYFLMINGKVEKFVIQ